MFYADSEAVEKKLTNCEQKVADPKSVDKQFFNVFDVCKITYSVWFT